MDALQMIMESRMRDRNPFRDMLQKMGAFGGATMQDMQGAIPTPQGPIPPQLAEQFQRIVKALIAQGMPAPQAIAKAKQIIQQMAAGGAPPESGIQAGMGIGPEAMPPQSGEGMPPEVGQGPMGGFSGGGGYPGG